MDPWIETAGWLGAFEVIGAYVWVSSGKVNGSHIGYQLLNMSGGILLIVNTWYKAAYPSMFVNIIWVLIAFWATFKPLIRATTKVIGYFFDPRKAKNR